LSLLRLVKMAEAIPALKTTGKNERKARHVPFLRAVGRAQNDRAKASRDQRFARGKNRG